MTVTGSLAGFPDSNITSPLVTIKEGKIAGAKPMIRGKAKVGKQLKVAARKWQADGAKVKLRYQWLANGKTIKKAKKKTLKVIPAMRGKRITVKVTGSAVGYQAKSRKSGKTARGVR